MTPGDVAKAPDVSMVQPPGEDAPAMVDTPVHGDDAAGLAHNPPAVADTPAPADDDRGTSRGVAPKASADVDAPISAEGDNLEFSGDMLRRSPGGAD